MNQEQIELIDELIMNRIVYDQNGESGVRKRIDEIKSLLAQKPKHTEFCGDICRGECPVYFAQQKPEEKCHCGENYEGAIHGKAKCYLKPKEPIYGGGSGGGAVDLPKEDFCGQANCVCPTPKELKELKEKAWMYDDLTK